MEDCNYNYSNNKKRVRDDSEESDLDSPEAKRIRDNLLLDILVDDSDESDQVVDGRDQAILDLDSVMKSFEEEISNSGSSPVQQAFIDLTSDSGDSQPELGYLLEASDDELGLPPTFSSFGEETKNENFDVSRICSSDAVGASQIWGFDDEIPNYDSFGFGICDEKDTIQNYNGNGDFLAFEGLFDYSDVSSGPADFSDFSWRPESLPAL